MERWLQSLDARVRSQSRTDDSLSERITALAGVIDQNYQALAKQLPDPKRLAAVDAEIEQLKRRVRCLERIGEGESEMVSSCHTPLDTEVLLPGDVICPPGTFGWAFELMRRGRWLTYDPLHGKPAFSVDEDGFIGKRSYTSTTFRATVCDSMILSKTWKLAE